MKSMLLAILIISFSVSITAQTRSRNAQRAIELNDLALGLSATNPDSTVALLKEAIRLDSTCAIAYWNLAGQYGHKAQYDDMTKTLEKVLVLRPNSTETLTLLGLLADRRGEGRKARDLFQRAMTLLDARLLKNPHDSTNTLIGRAVLLILSDHQQEGHSELNRLLPHLPPHDPRQAFESITKMQLSRSLLEGESISRAP